MGNLLDPSQSVTVICSALTVYLLARLWKLRPDMGLYAIMTIVWMAHTLIFYTALVLDGLRVIDLHAISETFFTVWSSTLRTHGAVTFVILFWIMLHNEIKRHANKH